MVTNSLDDFPSIDDMKETIDGIGTKIRKVLDRESANHHLLTQILATFEIESNRSQIAQWEYGKALLDIADRWIKTYRENNK